MQVLRQLEQVCVKDDGEGGEQSKTRVMHRMSALFAAHNRLKRQQLVKAQRARSIERAAAYDSLRALDHTMALCGKPLANFVEPATVDWKDKCTEPLQRGEVRSAIAAADDCYPYSVPEEPWSE